MAKKSVDNFYIDYEVFKLGLYALEDTTKAPFGTARIMRNMQVTSRGGIAPRKGTELIGTNNASASPVRGLYNFRKSFDQDEFLIKTYDDEMEVYSKNHSTDWARLKNGFTADKEFGFVTSLVNTDSEDYCIFCNRYQEYQRWSGATTKLSAALVGAETSVVVDSVLTEEIFESKTASASAATTLDISSADWAASQWVNMYVYITSGVHAGKIRKITANTTTQITFDTLGSDPSTPTFQIRKAAFPASGVIIYGGTTIAYTAIPEYNKFTVGSAHAAADDSLVFLVPQVYAAPPRGNRLTNYLGRIIVGNVRSALARDTGGALQGYASAGSYFVSKINTPTDFSFSATRVAGEGDIIGTPYGGSEITDVSHHEDTAYIFKPRYIESVKYSQDSNDLANRTPMKAEIGAKVPVIKGSDDIYFITDDNRFTSIGRVAQKDILPQTLNIGSPISRLLENYVFDFGRGIEDDDMIYIPAKSDSSQATNDILVVYNKLNQSFDGIWDIGANFFQRFNGALYFGDSTSPNVFKMNTGHADVVGTTRFPISSQYATHFMNLTGSHANSQSLNSLYFEGYIKGSTVITFEAFKEFSNTPFLQFDFSGDEESFLSGQTLNAFLGGAPLGLQPMGAVGEADEEGRRHFYFRVYFPFQYANHFSIGWASYGADLDYEVTRFGLGLSETVSIDTNTIKTI